ncbi:MAG: hypothetical protein UX25_C0020G0011, partial [Candidatus Woesebacteria bacterium GW2011_GWC2_45_9]
DELADVRNTYIGYHLFHQETPRSETISISCPVNNFQYQRL